MPDQTRMTWQWRSAGTTAARCRMAASVFDGGTGARLRIGSAAVRG